MWGINPAYSPSSPKAGEELLLLDEGELLPVLVMHERQRVLLRPPQRRAGPASVLRRCGGASRLLAL
jgi:hypothetical protein